MNECAELAIYLENYLTKIYTLPYIIIPLTMLASMATMMIFDRKEERKKAKNILMTNAFIFACTIVFIIVAPNEEQAKIVMHKKLCKQECKGMLKVKEIKEKEKNAEKVLKKITEQIKEYEKLTGKKIQLTETKL